MKKFEYKLVAQPRKETFEEITETLNSLGVEGWELCSTDYGCFIFKKETLKTVPTETIIIRGKKYSRFLMEIND